MGLLSNRKNEAMKREFLSFITASIEKAKEDLFQLGPIHEVTDIESKKVLLKRRMEIMETLANEVEGFQDGIERDLVRMENALEKLEKGENVMI